MSEVIDKSNKESYKHDYMYLGLDFGHYRYVDISSIQNLKRGEDLAEYVYDFIMEQGECLLLCHVYNGHCDYLAIRSLRAKEFLTYGDKKGIPYGLYYLDPDFKYGDLIVIVEGVKDRDALVKYVYRNVIANSGAGLSKLAKEILPFITNRVLLLYDNDETGNKSSYYDAKYLASVGISVVRGKHPNKVKDSGTLIEYERALKSFELEALIKAYSKIIENAKVGG